MKAIIAVTLLLACTYGLQITGEDGLIKFEMDAHQGSPVGLVMKGHVDPTNELNNKIETFLKLANTYVPLLESVNNQNNNLRWTDTWSFNIGIGTITFSGTFDIVVGWRVNLDNATDTDTQQLNVDYIPFVWGWANGLLQGDTIPAQGWYNATLWFARAYAPIGLDITANDVCYSGSASVLPVQLETTINSALKGCYSEIIDEVLAGEPIYLTCNYTAPFSQPHINLNFTNDYNNQFLNKDCITL